MCLRADLLFQLLLQNKKTLCRGVARSFYILGQELGLGFVAGSAPSSGVWDMPPRKFFRPL